MATNKTVKRALTQAELKKISKSYYQLVQILDNLNNSQALTSTAKKEVASFYKDIIKARSNFSVPRATDFKFGSLI